MSADWSVGLCGENELERLGAVMADAFAVPPEHSSEYFDLVGRENLRVVRRAGEVAGGLAVIPKGQWFGGRAVPMVGIAAVATAPEQRARGAATELLKAVLLELHEQRTPISTLCPATLALYRRVGYESAGLECNVRVPTKLIGVRERSLDIRESGPDDQRRVREVYREWARGTAGNLDRTEFHWRRVMKYRGESTRGYVVCRGESIEGYAYVLTRKEESGAHCLRVVDMAAVTPAAVRRLLTFFADYRTTRDRVEWRSSPADPMLMHLPEATFEISQVCPWMLRVVHVPRALAARGYPVGATGEIHFCVHDELLPANEGRFVLRVADGRGRVERGGQGTFEVDIRGLAALYTGFLTPGDLVLGQLATAREADLAVAAGLFAGPLPWMRDEF